MQWNLNDKRVVGLIPELDDYLTPEPARLAFSVMPKFEQIDVLGAKHLWVGEDATRRVLNEIIRVVAPHSYPLPNEYEQN